MNSVPEIGYVRRSDVAARVPQSKKRDLGSTAQKGAILTLGTPEPLIRRRKKPLELNVIQSGLPQPGASQITKDAAVAGRFAPASATAIIHSAEIGRSEHFAMVFLLLIRVVPCL